VSDPLNGSRWQIITGGCLDLMRSLPDGSVDAVVTDPPYDEKTHNGAMSRHSDGGGKWKASKHDIDFIPLNSYEWLDQAFRVSKGWVIAFCSLEMFGAYATHAGTTRWVRAGIWHKTNSTPQFSGDRPAQACEGIAIMHSGICKKEWNGGGSRGFWSTHTEKGFLAIGGRHHPTQKPVPLMADLVDKFVAPGGLVLDPFCGSGSTGVACAREGMRFLGMELSEDYATIARRRIADAYAQGKFDFFQENNYDCES
jgi:site-specific DNA-methyltransferase (adenine-specific)